MPTSSLPPPTLASSATSAHTTPSPSLRRRRPGHAHSRSTDLLPADPPQPPRWWSSLHKLAVCCPGLLHAGVLLDPSDFGLELDIGPDHSFPLPALPPLPRSCPLPLHRPPPHRPPSATMLVVVASQARRLLRWPPPSRHPPRPFRLRPRARHRPGPLLPPPRATATASVMPAPAPPTSSPPTPLSHHVGGCRFTSLPSAALASSTPASSSTPPTSASSATSAQATPSPSPRGRRRGHAHFRSTTSVTCDIFLSGNICLSGRIGKPA